MIVRLRRSSQRVATANIHSLMSSTTTQSSVKPPERDLRSEILREVQTDKRKYRNGEYVQLSESAYSV